MNKLTVDNYRQDKYYPKIVRAVDSILCRKDYFSAIDILIEIQLLDSKNASDWRAGKIPFLEKVIMCNLSKVNRILRIMRFHAWDLCLKPSTTDYKRKGKPLRFSKSGDRKLEQAYSTHYVIIGKRNPWKEGEPRQPKPPEARSNRSDKA